MVTGWKKKSSGYESINISPLGWYLIIDSLPPVNQADFIASCIFFVFSLKDEYCRKSFHLQVNVTFPPLLFVLCCFYSFHIPFFFCPIRHFLLSSHFSFFCSPFSNISFFFPVGLFSSQEISGWKIVEECFLCLARGKSLHSGPSLKEMGLNSWGAYADDTCPVFLPLLHYTLFPGSLDVKICFVLSCISSTTPSLSLCITICIMPLLQTAPLRDSSDFLPSGVWGPSPHWSFHLWSFIWWCECTEQAAGRIITQFKHGWIHRWTIPYERAFFK